MEMDQDRISFMHKILEEIWKDYALGGGRARSMAAIFKDVCNSIVQ